MKISQKKLIIISQKTNGRCFYCNAWKCWDRYSKANVRIGIPDIDFKYFW